MNDIVVPLPKRQRSVAISVLAGAVLLALLIIAASEVIAQARVANASAHRAVAEGLAPACPTVAMERTP